MLSKPVELALAVERWYGTRTLPAERIQQRVSEGFVMKEAMEVATGDQTVSPHSAILVLTKHQ